MQPVAPFSVVDLFAPLHDQLLDLLRGLDAADWGKPTAAPLWRVRDVTAHLLDVDLRELSVRRDGAAGAIPDAPIASYRDLVAHLDRLNAEWVRASRRLSPRVLVELLVVTGPQVAAMYAALDPKAPAPYGVGWAGEDVSPNWFELGRQYTERWHHQQQIRDAVGAPGLTTRRWLQPVLDVSVRALPFAYRAVDGDDGQTLSIIITGEAGGTWSLVRVGGAWALFTGAPPTPATRITLEQDAAWRLFFKQLTPDQAAARVMVEGDRRPGEQFLTTLAVMA